MSLTRFFGILASIRIPIVLEEPSMFGWKAAENMIPGVQGEFSPALTDCHISVCVECEVSNPSSLPVPQRNPEYQPLRRKHPAILAPAMEARK
jgi:hypothetical protein